MFRAAVSSVMFPQHSEMRMRRQKCAHTLQFASCVLNKRLQFRAWARMNKLYVVFEPRFAREQILKSPKSVRMLFMNFASNIACHFVVQPRPRTG